MAPGTCCVLMNFSFYHKASHVPPNLSRVLDLSVFWLMGIFIFLNPFPHVTSLKEIAFYLSVALVVFGMATRKLDFSFKTPLTLPFVLFSAWAALGLFFALDLENSLHDFYAHLLKYLAFYYILVNCCRTQKRLGWLSWIIILSATAFCVGALGYEYWVLGENVENPRFGVRFVQTPTNLMGVVTLFALILTVHYLTKKHVPWKVRVLLGFCLISMLCVTILTLSRSNFVAMGVVSVILLSRYKKVFWGFVVLFALFVLLSPMKDRFILSERSDISDRGSILHRISLAYISYEIIKDYPVWGTGFGIRTFQNREAIDPYMYNGRLPENLRMDAWAPAINKDVEDEDVVDILFKCPHNMFLNVGVRTGIVGLLLFLWILFAAARMCWHTIQHGKTDALKSWGYGMAACYVMFLIKGSLDPVFTHLTEVVFFTILGMITIVWNSDSPSISPATSPT